MALLKAPNKQPKTTTLQVRLEEGVRRNLDNCAAFIDASSSYVVDAAVKTAPVYSHHRHAEHQLVEIDTGR